MKILVTGAGGQLAEELAACARLRPSDQFVFLSRQQLDITHPRDVASVLALHRPDFCINTAAYTAVDQAESDREHCFRVNADAVQLLAKACGENGVRFLHLSTDYVFDGNGNRPYREEDPTAPQGVYGASKRKGEELCLLSNPDAIIMRTSWVYSSYGNNFVKTMLRLMPEKETLRIVNDQQGCPTYAADLAAAILHILDSGKWVPGLFHFCNEGVVTWFMFARQIREHCGFTTVLEPISSAEYPVPARRPFYSVLDTTRFHATWNFPIRSWNACLPECLEKLGCKTEAG